MDRVGVYIEGIGASEYRRKAFLIRLLHFTDKFHSRDVAHRYSLPIYGIRYN